MGATQWPGGGIHDPGPRLDPDRRVRPVLRGVRTQLWLLRRGLRRGLRGQGAGRPNGLAAVSKIPAYGWIQIVAYALYCEASALNFGYFDEAFEAKAPGDYGWRPPLLATDDAEKKKTRLNAELANGRLAMMAIIGMFFQDGLTGSAWGDWALYTDSPLR